jgi:predicted transposase YbfD/YdcC
VPTVKELEMSKETIGFLDFFRQIPDHRINRRKVHRVEEILLVTFCGIITGCDGWDDIELYGNTKLDFLRRYLPFKSGVASDDTLRRFFRALDPEKFESCFINWVRSFQMDLESKVVAIDGKTSRGSFDGENRPLHLLNAFVSELGLSLGQLKVDSKSNEITAIPALLDMLDLAESIVTIDAMGCQSAITEKIIENKADYVLALKGNQGTLHEDVEMFFKRKLPKIKRYKYEENSKGHGRNEIRKCIAVEDIDWLSTRHPQWFKLKSIIEIESTREIKGTSTTEKRYYISSLGADPQNLLHIVRQHWGIENKLHWVLDVCFGEDKSRIRKGNAPRNIAIIKKTALNLLQIIKPTRHRISLKRMIKLAGWDNDFLNEVLRANF